MLSIPNCSIVTYADDTALVVEGKTWNEVRVSAEAALNIVTLWLSQNLLTLNVSKTSYITFSGSITYLPPKNNFNIKVHHCDSASCACCSCPDLTRSESIKYLGIIIDQTLSMHQHIHSLSARTRKLIFIFKKLRSSASCEILQTVYYALAQSILSYCIAAWGGVPKTTLLLVERAQRAVLKVMWKKPYRYPTSALYSECQILTVRQMFIAQVIVRTHASSTYDHSRYSLLRRKDLIFECVRNRTALAARQYYVVGPLLYNRASKFITIYPLSVFECKDLVKNWLMTLNYDKTEELLIVLV